MSAGFNYHFEWDPAKALANQRKHGIRFEQAVTVFQDPLALSRLDEEHGGSEERWVTLGQADHGTLLVVVHTYREMDEHNAAVRMISARAATRHEQRQYESK
jgi:uncharacterized DUF497 family protein